MVDVSQLERTLDLWASMWQPRERVLFENAIVRVVHSDGPLPLRLAALAACQVIGSPRLLGVAEGATETLDEISLDAIAEVAEPRARLMRHALRMQHDIFGVKFLLEKAVRDPDNPVADKLLERVDVRDLYAAMHAVVDEEVRVEAARRLARRGPHQRSRLLAALDLDADEFDEQLAVDVPLDDLDDCAGNA
jgi:hypothetical protein